MAFIGREEAARRRRARIVEWAETVTDTGAYVDIQQMIGDNDRLRAQVAELETAGDELAEAGRRALDPTGHARGSRLDRAVDAWRAVRGERG